MADHILSIIAEATDEPDQLKFINAAESTHLHLAMALQQPLVVRAFGRHPYSVYGRNPLEIDLEGYVKKTEIARKSSGDLAFQVKNIGLDLWRDIFERHQEAYMSYVKAQTISQPLSLVFETTSDLLQLPLEFIRKSKASVPLILEHPFKRFLSDISVARSAVSPNLLALKKQISVLIIASNTKPRIDGVDAEAAALYNFLKNEQTYIDVKVKLITTERATYNHIKDELRKPVYDIIHYAGHGWHNANDPDESSLFFWPREDKQGEPVAMKATELTLLLKQSTARMVYLSCCLGTATSNKTSLLKDDFLGLADAVVQAGVPTILGFRWPVSDERAQQLALSFYDSLLEQGSPEIALWRARCELYSADKNEPTWLSPILISQD
jgi:hypothetical protein